MHVCAHFRGCIPCRQVPSFRYPIPLRQCTGVDPTQKAIGNLLLSRSTWRLWSRKRSRVLFPLKDATVVCLRACRDRGRSYPIPNSPPGCIPRSPAPLSLLAWLAPGWANLDGNSSSSAFSHSKNTLVILTKKRLSYCCRISSRFASSSNSNRSSSYSSRFSPSRAPPLQQRCPQRCWIPAGQCSS